MINCGAKTFEINFARLRDREFLRSSMKMRTHLVREASGRSRGTRRAVDSNDCSPPFPWRSFERPLPGSYRSWPIVIVLERTRNANASVPWLTSPGSSCTWMSVRLIWRLGDARCSRFSIVTSYDDGTRFVRIACRRVLGWKHDSSLDVALCVSLVHVGGDSP